MNDTLEQARAQFVAGNAHFGERRLEPALACFRAALALAPGRPSVMANLGVTLLELGQLEQALEYLVAATTADADQPDAWVALGLARESQGDWHAAVDALQQAHRHGAQSLVGWMALGRCQSRLGDVAGAMRAFDAVIAREPELADAWSARGGLLRDQQRFEEAAHCFERALALGADETLHRFYLASVRGQSEQPEQPPRAYVEALFDQYAGDFESHLVDKLKYQTFETLLRPLADANARFGLVLDLGCGTGLSARLVRDRAQAIDGVDISMGMVEKARASGIYRHVAHGDLIAFLQEGQEAADLVIAADVLVYVGALEALFAAVRARLGAGGLFAFSVESHAGPQAMALLPSLRYAHSASYVRLLAREHGLAVHREWEAPMRQDHGKPVLGLYFYLMRTP